MSSKAYNDVLVPLAADVRELLDAHVQLRTGVRGRQWRLGALNRSAVIMAVSAWEGFVEALLVEAVNAVRPPGVPPAGAGAAPPAAPPPAAPPPAGPGAAPVVIQHWPALAADAVKQAAKLNTPDTRNVNWLFRSTLGIPKLSDGWSWRGSTVAIAEANLDALMKNRHEVAHGVNPRPTIHNKYAAWLPGFIERLGEASDKHLAAEMVRFFGVTPW